MDNDVKTFRLRTGVACGDGVTNRRLVILTIGTVAWGFFLGFVSGWVMW